MIEVLIWSLKSALRGMQWEVSIFGNKLVINKVKKKFRKNWYCNLGNRGSWREF